MALATRVRRGFSVALPGFLPLRLGLWGNGLDPAMVVVYINARWKQSMVFVDVAGRGARWMDSCPNELPWACACHFAGELQGSMANENLREWKLVPLG